MKSYIWFIPAFLVFIGILILSTALSVPIQIEGVSYTDKLGHAFAYMVLMVTFLFAFHKNEKLTKSIWVILILFAISYGTLLELVQYLFFPNRYFEWKDALANITGVFIGSVVFRLIRNV